MNRGRHREVIFDDATDYRFFIHLLGDVAESHSFVIHAYCLMPNHFHIMATTPDANIDACMRILTSEYAQKRNFFRELDGGVFKGRFKSVAVNTNSQAFYLSRYIHRNPIEAKKPLTRELSSYKWSSYPFYLYPKSSPKWLSTELILGYAGRSSATYRSYVEKTVQPEPLGLDYLTDEHIPLSKPADVVMAISGIADIDPSLLTTGLSGRGRANKYRDLAVSLAAKYCPADEVRSTFGVGSRSGLKRYRDRHRVALEGDISLQILRQKVREVLKRN